MSKALSKAIAGGTVVGYARTSTTEQQAGLEAQKRDLKKAGCKKFYEEQTSATGPRPALAQAMDFVRHGDTLVVTKLDRLARSVADLVRITERLKLKKVALRILALNLDTKTPTGTLMLNMLGAIAQFERELMLERQREGIAKAKADGKYKGRAPTAMAKAGEVKRLAATGMTKEKIARKLDIGVASVYRALKTEAPASPVSPRRMTARKLPPDPTDGTKDEGEDDSGIRSDRMDKEPPLGWDENKGELVFYNSLEEAMAATKPPMIIDPANPSMDDDDISDLGHFKWMERIK